MSWLLNLVGSPILKVVGVASAAILISWLMIQYGKNIEGNQRDLNDLQNQIDNRETIDESIRNSPSDPLDALNQLRERQSQ